MTKVTENMVTEDVFVNYKGSDKDNCLHFLTHVHVNVKNVSDENQKVQLSDIISPTVKRIYTSRYNAWYLKKNFDVEHIDVQGFETNKCFKITFNGNRYIYSFIDSMFSTGSVALLLHGPFGTCLYTGYFSFYREFLQSPVLKPVIKERALSTLYFDATYYERSFSYEGFDELIKSVVNLIRKKIDKKIYLYSDKGKMEHLIAQIALQLKEKVYVSEDTLEIMRLLGHEEANFTCEPSETRIYVNKAFMRKRGRDNENILIKINRITEEKFIPGKKKKNPYDFDFYCSSNNKEICELIDALKPETTVELYRVLDRSKITYNDKFKNIIPQEQLNIVEKAYFSRKTSEPPVRIINYKDSIKSPLSNTPAREHKDFNNGNRLRARRLPEMNICGLSTVSTPVIVDCKKERQDDVLNDDLTSMDSNIPSNEPNNNKEAKSSSGNILLLPSPHILHNYAKPKPQNIIKTNSQSLGESCSILRTINNNEKQSSSGTKPKAYLPLVMNSKLVKDKKILLKNCNLVSSANKNKIVILSNKLIETPPQGTNDKCTSSSFDNVKKCIPKKTVSILKKGKILSSSLSNMRGISSPLQSHSNSNVEVGVNNSLNKTVASSAVMTNNVTPKESSCSKTKEITVTASLVKNLNESCRENGTMGENKKNSLNKAPSPSDKEQDLFPREKQFKLGVNNLLNKTVADSAVNIVTAKESSFSITKGLMQTTSFINILNAAPCPSDKEEELIIRKKKLEIGVNNLLNETFAASAVNSNIVTPKESSCNKTKATTQTTSFVDSLNGTMGDNTKKSLNSPQSPNDQEEALINRKKQLKLGDCNLISETFAGCAVKSNIVIPKESSCSKTKEITVTTSLVKNLNESCRENGTMGENKKNSLNKAPSPSDKEQDLFPREKQLKLGVNNLLNKTVADSAVNIVTAKESSFSITKGLMQTTSFINILNAAPCPSDKEEELIIRKKKLEIGVNNLLNETFAASAVNSNIVTPKESSCNKTKATTQTTSFVDSLNGTMGDNTKKSLNSPQSPNDQEEELINRKKQLKLGDCNLISETFAGCAVKSKIVIPKESSCSKTKEITVTTSLVTNLNESCRENGTMGENKKNSLNKAPSPSDKEQELIHRNKKLKITGDEVDSLINPSTIAQCPSDKENGSFGRKKKLEVSRIDVDSHNNTEGKNKGTGSKRKLSLINEETTMSRKKLRSDTLMTNLLQPKPVIKEEPKPVIKEEQQTIPCSVSLDQNEMNRTYFYSSYCEHFLPKFYGFKRYELRPRKQLLKLRYLEKLIKN